MVDVRGLRVWDWGAVAKQGVQARMDEWSERGARVGRLYWPPRGTIYVGGLNDKEVES